MELTKASRSLIRSLYTRHGRKKCEKCVVEGVRAVGEVLLADPSLVDFMVCTPRNAPPGFSGDVAVVPESILAEIANTVSSQGILAVCHIPPPADDKTISDKFIVALDRVGDPGNFGTICRTAKAAGLSELWMTAGTVEPFGDKAIRSALGSQFSMNLRYFPDLAAMRDFGAARNFAPLYLTDPHRGANCFTAPSLYDHSILVIGSEGAGVSDLPDAPRVMIPMPGNFESLNAAQAATIFIFEFVRRQFV